MKRVIKLLLWLSSLECRRLELKALLELKGMSAAHGAFWKVTWHFLGHVGQTLCKLLCVY